MNSVKSPTLEHLINNATDIHPSLFLTVYCKDGHFFSRFQNSDRKTLLSDDNLTIDDINNLGLITNTDIKYACTFNKFSQKYNYINPILEKLGFVQCTVEVFSYAFIPEKE